jgi:NAD-dependent deacetylase
LERAGFLNAVITQNVDGLHQMAGNTNVIEYHGNHRQLKCPSCSSTQPFTENSMKALPYPTCEKCGDPLKPDVVFFGEEIPLKAMLRADEAARRCKVMVIIGTSGVVYPAADIPFMAASNGATIVEINVTPTPFTSSITTHFLAGSSSTILPAIIAELGLRGE